MIRFRNSSTNFKMNTKFLSFAVILLLAVDVGHNFLMNNFFPANDIKIFFSKILKQSSLAKKTGAKKRKLQELAAEVTENVKVPEGLERAVVIDKMLAG